MKANSMSNTSNTRIDCTFSYRGQRTITIPVTPNPLGPTDYEPARKQAAKQFWGSAA